MRGLVSVKPLRSSSPHPNPLPDGAREPEFFLLPRWGEGGLRPDEGVMRVERRSIRPLTPPLSPMGRRQASGGCDSQQLE